MNYVRFKSPVGILHLVASENELYCAAWNKNWEKLKSRFSNLTKDVNPLLEETIRQLEDYFKGKRRSFDVPVHLEGTDFQKKVWRSLLKIPYGRTLTYKQQAELIALPKTIRAVGRTNGLNPISIIVPCHRVIGSSGKLIGYAGGIETKESLLVLERKYLKN